MFGRNKKEPEMIRAPKREEIRPAIKDIFELIKYGHDIGLTILNEDSSDALERVLDLGKVRFTLSEWSEWTLSIDLCQGGDRFRVYTSPPLKITWLDDKVSWDSPIIKPLEVQWDHRGNWCDYIMQQVEELKAKLESKRLQDKLNAEAQELAERKLQQQLIEHQKQKYSQLFD